MKPLLLASVLMTVGCGHGGPRPDPGDEAATTPPTRRSTVVPRCATDAVVDRRGAPFSDDLSGVALGSAEPTLSLLVHDDSLAAEGSLFVMDSNTGEARSEIALGVPLVDPEDLAVATIDGRKTLFFADFGDNRGRGRCLRFERDDAMRTCRTVGVRRDAATAEACAETPDGVWVQKTLDQSRERPPTIYRFAVSSDDSAVELIATLRFRRLRCAGLPCRDHTAFGDTDSNPASADEGDWPSGRFNIEAVFIREKRPRGAPPAPTLYIVTKAPYPLTAAIREQRDEQCRFPADGQAHVFRLAGVASLEGEQDVGDRFEHVALLDLANGGLNDAARTPLAVRVTGADFDSPDLVLLTRDTGYRWRVRPSVPKLDQSFFDDARPCRIALPPASEAAKLEGIVLMPRAADGARSYFTISEGGDFARRGPEGLHRITEHWP